MVTTLALAAVLGQPCPLPAPVVHHKHHAHVAVLPPAQTCVTLPVQMCFRDVPEPDLEPIAAPLTYYIFSDNTTPPPDDSPPGYDSGYGYFGGLGGFGGFGGSAGGPAPPPSSGSLWKHGGPEPYHVRPPHARAPELDTGSAFAAYTLLCGVLAVLRGRRA